MKIDDITDYGFEPRQHDESKLFKVVQSTNKNGSVDTFYNLNDGFVIEGIESLDENNVHEYTCRNNDDLRFISYDIYGSSEYWWILAKMNGITDCLIKLQAGQKIKYVEKYYLNIIYRKIREGMQ